MENTKNKILSNGVNIPIIGFGTYRLENTIETTNIVKTALDIGYRHIDTASFYENEEAIGKAINSSSIKREDIFLVTKVWNSDQGYDKTIKAFDSSLKKLSTEYIDLYLIHWPKDLSLDTWKAFESLYQSKKIRAIGVSNFMINQLDNIIENSEIVPMVNQIELHPMLIQNDLLDYCKNRNIQVEAWSPLMQGHINEIEEIKTLAYKYNKTPAQIVLRWNVQLGIVTIPKSSNIDRIKSNFQIFDFKLSDNDMDIINSLNNGSRIGPDPNNFDF